MFNELICDLPVFGNSSYACLPKHSLVFPIFTLNGFIEECETMWAGDNETTVDDWYVHEHNIFKPVDLMLDHIDRQLTSKYLSSIVSLDKLAMSRLPKPERDNLSGKCFIGFYFYHYALKG
jgi:hypothetical protein